MCHTEALINLLMILDAQVNTGRIKLHPVCIGHWVWTGGGGGPGGGGRVALRGRRGEGGGEGRGRAVGPQWTLTIVVYYGPEQWRRHVIWLNPAGGHDICMAQAPLPPPSPTKLSYPPPPTTSSRADAVLYRKWRPQEGGSKWRAGGGERGV